jgi:hypothetical protein
MWEVGNLRGRASRRADEPVACGCGPDDLHTSGKLPFSGPIRLFRRQGRQRCPRAARPGREGPRRYPCLDRNSILPPGALFGARCLRRAPRRENMLRSASHAASQSESCHREIYPGCGAPVSGRDRPRDRSPGGGRSDAAPPRRLFRPMAMDDSDLTVASLLTVSL